MERFKLWLESAMQNSGDPYLNVEAVNQDSPPAVKIALFRSLFRGRTDVYPVRFESHKTGKNRVFACMCKRVGARNLRET
jgi:hypothetical protein